ncbi:signal transduction histidine kinase [Streptosporangium becharense]|uniref:Oxygen sensor histidine kinase NreB n=1 Tax=Streptosporangium becharense TaxID=1816182 RepID=A0A7W9ID58_9ACTN|nr:sensor histidine kinase [Streptosporangium becharense]MBB2911950.1 signal transduction histidine kinase [Streptosporangium becharense]MBB5818497.1 signal transduction histidine kinase [Streptosporangium becharense]
MRDRVRVLAGADGVPRRALDAVAVTAAGPAVPLTYRLPGSAVRLASAAVAVVSIGLAVAAFVIVRGLPAAWAPSLPATPSLTAGLTFPVVGAFLLSHRARPATAWLMCAGGLMSALTAFAEAMTLGTAAGGDLATAGYFRWATQIFYVLGAAVLAVLLPLYSPDGRLPSRRWRPVVAATAAMVVIHSLASLLRPDPDPADYPWPRVIPNPLGVEALAPYAPALNQFPIVATVVLAMLALASLILRFRRAGPLLRRQIAWPLSAFAVYVIFIVGQEHTWLPGTLWAPVIPLAIAFSVLRYRLYGIDTVISRAFVAAGLLAVVSGIYVVGAVAGLALSGYDRIGGLVAALFAGVIFHPLRRRLRSLVDRLMYGTHGDPRAFAARLAREVRVTEPANALASVAAVVKDGLSVTGVAVEVYEPGARQVQVGLLGPAPREMPLVWHGEPVGRLILGSPGPRRFAAAHNERLIAVAAPYVADVAHAVRMTSDLQRSRERILAAREEERRRLRRDLHDGLGHALTDMAMSINMAMINLRTAPASADRLLLELRGGMDAVSQEIRELVYGLRPPTLDELGLAGAVRTLAVEGTPRVAVEIEGDLANLPAAVEVAAYRIAQEALTNIRKHAGARSAVVSLTRGESLVVRIRDDGHGLPEESRSGIGLLSMRERAAELGGSCVIEPAPGGGTVVEAVLPIPSVPAPAGSPESVPVPTGRV